MQLGRIRNPLERGFSALQRAEIAEIASRSARGEQRASFSALQRAEIAEIVVASGIADAAGAVSVLFNEPKLLKFAANFESALFKFRFSALQRAEIAEMERGVGGDQARRRFQCSSTSRNC